MQVLHTDENVEFHEKDSAWVTVSCYIMNSKNNFEQI